MKRAHISPLLLVLTATISLCSGIGITLVAEDLAGVPMDSYESGEISIPKDLLDKALDYILEYLKNHPEAINDELIEKLKKEIEEKLKNGDLTEEELMELWKKYGDVIGPYLSEYLEQMLNNIKDPVEGDEPSFNYGSETMAIDDGSLDPDADQTEIFQVDSNYKGSLYIRSTSYGDYLYGKGSFDQAPEFDGSTYMASPLLYAGYAMENKCTSYSLTFHLNSFFNTVGMLVGDYSATSYTVSGKSTRFSRSTESRIRRTGELEYTVDFYPSTLCSPSDYSLPSYLTSEEENYYAFARANYTAVPEQMSQVLSDFIRDSSLSSNSTPKEVEQFFKTKYSYQAQSFSPSYGEDVVVSFLESEEKVGTCTNFASAMTLICRSLGMPARVVGGYAFKAIKGENSVKASSAHSWVEVYDGGHGWVRYDPTPTVKGKDEADQNDGSDGEVGDKAYSPTATNKLFSYSTTYSGNIYFRASSFADYDPEESSFLYDEISAENSSLLYTSSALDSSYYPNYLIQMNMGAYRDSSMIFASYPTSTYVEGEENDEELYDTAVRVASDGRYWREDISEYTYSFYPESSYSVSSIDDSAYRSSYLPTYLNLPVGYEAQIRSFCNLNNINSLSDLLYFFYSECDLDNSLTEYEGDAIMNFLNNTHSGNSSVFAGAYTLISRYFGIPARYVAGYKVKSKGYQTASQSVKASDTYYWVETYQEGFGWTRVDPAGDLVCRPGKVINITLSAVGSSYSYDGTSHKPSIEENIKVTCTDSSYKDDELFATGLFQGDYISEARFASSMETTKCKTFNSLPFLDVKISDRRGRDVTSKYNITYSYKAVFEVTKREITVTTSDYTKYSSDSSYTLTQSDLDAYSSSYIDYSLSNPKETINPIDGSIIKEPALALGDTVVVSYPEDTLDTYDVPSNITPRPTIAIFNANGEEVTEQYSINYVYSGTISFVSNSETEA